MFHLHHGIIFAILTKHMFFFDAIFVFSPGNPGHGEFRLRLEYQVSTLRSTFSLLSGMDHQASAHAGDDYGIRLHHPSEPGHHHLNEDPSVPQSRGFSCFPPPGEGALFSHPWRWPAHSFLFPSDKWVCIHGLYPHLPDNGRQKPDRPLPVNAVITARIVFSFILKLFYFRLHPVFPAISL